MFLKNAWYVAAWDHEITRSLTPCRLLDEPVVLYRSTAGQVVALEDACPHRKLPLSMGRLKGDEVECGYHGLTFDAAGTCTRVPGAERIPHRACVKSYPAVERYGLVWLWMGDPALADPAKIIEVAHWDNPAWGVNRGDSMHVACNYLYVTDNLLDPSHVAWVHQGSFGGAGTDEVALQTDVHEKGVTVSRWLMDTPPAPFYAPYLTFSGNCDRKQHYEVHWPSHAIIRAIFTPAGTGGEGRALHADAFIMDSYNFMTPVSATETRYYWFQMRNFAPGDEDVSARFAASVRAAFDEDRQVLEAVQRGMDAMQNPNLDLAIDLGPLRFRTRLARMIEAEEAAAAP
ncbi:MAG: aromatic ring-hydroxylating dioxygenase subunit alpha [Pararhodobacter sp.]|nr:aromatic ring-hydroxylating dioxygenase subunit alpha [Pararhodobacter sp.]